MNVRNKTVAFKRTTKISEIKGKDLQRIHDDESEHVFDLPNRIKRTLFWQEKESSVPHHRRSCGEEYPEHRRRFRSHAHVSRSLPPRYYSTNFERFNDRNYPSIATTTHRTTACHRLLLTDPDFAKSSKPGTFLITQLLHIQRHRTNNIVSNFNKDSDIDAST